MVDRFQMFTPFIRSLRVLHSHEKHSFLILVFARIFVQLLDVAGIVMFGIFTSVLAGTWAGSQSSSFLGIQIISVGPNFATVLGLVLFGLFALKSLFGMLLIQRTAHKLAEIESRATTDLSKFLFCRDYLRLIELTRGEVQWVLQNSTQQAFSSVLFVGSTIIAESALLFFIVATIAVLDPFVVLGLVAYFGAIAGLYQFAISRKLKNLGDRTTRLYTAVNEMVLEIHSVLKEMLVLERVPFFLERFSKKRSRLAHNRASERVALSAPRFLLETSFIGGVVGAVALSLMFSANLIEPGLVGVILAGGARLVASLLPLQNAVSELRVTGPQALQVHSLLESMKDEPPSASSFDISLPSFGDATGPSRIFLNGVHFVYPRSSIASVSNVSLSVGAGTITAIVGPSGSGKTTLVNLILGILQPSSGEIIIGGFTPAALRAAVPGSVAYVPQDPSLVIGTVAENVALGCARDEMDFQRIVEVIDAAGLSEFISGLPNGLETHIKSGVSKLSAGQVQRIGIARALYHRPKLLVLDEATSSLDSESQSIVMKTLASFRGEITTVLVAHRLETTRIADCIVVMDEGKMVGKGSFEELRSSIPLFERYVTLSDS